jgi:hypothetical protein
MWGNYAPANFTLIYAVADRATEKPRLVQAVAGNLAATDASKTATARGPTQAWSGSVPTLALDDILEDGAAEVELLHMCPQGAGLMAGELCVVDTRVGDCRIRESLCKCIYICMHLFLLVTWAYQRWFRGAIVGIRESL